MPRKTAPPYDHHALRAEIRRDEGYRIYPYVDTAGKITVGIGWNLTDNGLPGYCIENLYEDAVADAEYALDGLYQDWPKLSERRKRALLNMAYNLGENRLAGFKKMWEAITLGCYEVAAQEMLNSKWAKQVGERASRLAEMMREG